MKKFKFNKNSIVAGLAIASILGFYAPTTALAATNPNLGAASTYSVLAQTGITGTGTIAGNVENNGIAAAITGLTAAMIGVGSAIYSSDAGNTTGTPPAPTTLLNAAVQANASTVYTATIPGLGIEGTPIVGASLNGITRGPGVYDLVGASITLTTTLTLDGPGTYIFRVPANLTSSGSINFINGARPCDLFWRVASDATINGTSFAGTILALAGIHFGAGVTLDGRALAVGADVTLLGTTISGPSCPTPPPAPVAASGGTPAAYPLFTITKVPSPLSLPSGPGSVTYTYTMKNYGTDAVGAITVQDDKCGPVNFVSGDTSRNNMLDVSETWVYSCTKTVSKTETNTVVAYGNSNGNGGYATANATVVVNASLVPPLIHVVKIPSKLILPLGGGAVTYNYTVTNPGTAPLNNVSITDNKCTGLPGRVVGHPGDLNHNDLLENNEVWQFTCATNITKTTTNVATAEGHANGLVAIDYAQATVVVAPPKLPNTGFGPEDKSNTLWSILVPTGIIALLFSLYVARKKRTV